MKRISLVAVLLLFTLVTGFAQKSKVKIRVKVDSVFVPKMEFPAFSSSYVDSIASSYSQLFSDACAGMAPLEFTLTSSNFDMLLATLSKRDDVTTITITKSLLDIMPDINSYVEENGVNIQKVVAKLEHIDIVSSTSDAAKKIMRTVNNDVISTRPDGKKVVLMRIKKEEENIVFYGEKDAKNENIKSLILFSDSKSDKENSILIRLVGVFNKDDLKQIIKIKSKNK